jgi:hypothetical protein
VNVVLFPNRAIWNGPQHPVSEKLIRIAAVVKVLGEPASAEEIADMLVLCSQPVWGRLRKRKIEHAKRA